jgi:hypothetical protein
MTDLARAGGIDASLSRLRQRADDHYGHDLDVIAGVASAILGEWIPG